MFPTIFVSFLHYDPTLLRFCQGYAWEVTTTEGGWGLDELLRSRKAVINGVIKILRFSKSTGSIVNYITYLYYFFVE